MPLVRQWKEFIGSIALSLRKVQTFSLFFIQSSGFVLKNGCGLERMKVMRQRGTVTPVFQPHGELEQDRCSLSAILGDGG